ncbi:glucose dehydrogenase [FAD, quinone]-like [Mercenaria mercenaria]|uniref:glucose dehydrogenase [FAD, quinone]-like n=1 Tax=Mercenaria mercenaria TaxID=6596 RepID=UPI00234E53D3|nr:glucose dehydrogenase [FAD, quinone]-like [Mercenaria mercenaria]
MSYRLPAFAAAVFTIICSYCFRETNRFSHHRVILSDTIDDVYDYVIVGGGSAGSVLASRLSEEKSNKVLLLEADGFYDENPNFHSLIYWPTLQKTEFDWSYYIEPQRMSCLGMKGKRGYWPRGRVLGGSGILNAGQYTRGSRYDYDEWAKNGCKGWSYNDVLPYFLKSEDIKKEELKSSKYHHIGGPMAISESDVTPFADLYLKAGKELGYNLTDYNGKTQEGFSKTQINTRRGVRDSSAVAFLGNVEKRDNLDIAINTFVTKVDTEEKKATGVYYIRNGRKKYVKANREVILSSGAINTPHWRNLKDHQTIFLRSKINKSISLTDSVLESYKTRLQYKLFGTGPLSTAGTEGTAFFYTNENNRRKTYADIQVLFVSRLLTVGNNNHEDAIQEEYDAGSKNADGFTWVQSNTHPKSRGTSTLRSKDPFDHPVIDPQYFTDTRDMDDFISGIRIWEKFLQTPTMKGLGVESEDMKMSFCSQFEFRSDEYWECMVRHLAVTIYHPCCMCKMGSENDANAVVDTDLRVKGIKGLRVVDASVFPQILGGNINAPVIMLAEKASDMIRGIDSVESLRDSLSNGI